MAACLSRQCPYAREVRASNQKRLLSQQTSTVLDIGIVTTSCRLLKMLLNSALMDVLCSSAARYSTMRKLFFTHPRGPPLHFDAIACPKRSNA
jgi:hypothetical protein